MVKYIIEFDLEKYSPELFKILTKELQFTIYVYDVISNSITILNENYSDKIVPIDKGDGTIKYHALYNANKLPVDDIINRLEQIKADLPFKIEKRVF